MKILKIIGILIVVGSMGCTDKTKIEGVTDPIFEGIGNLRYNPLSESLEFDGYKDDYFLNVKNQVKDELIFFDDPGSFKLEYRGRYNISLLNGKDTVGGPVIFYKDKKNYGSKFTITTNLVNHGFQEPLYGTLNDGLLGSVNPRDGQWWCWENENAAIVIDLGEQLYVGNMSFRYYEDIDQNIYPPSTIKISGSYDGTEFMTFSVKGSFMPAEQYFKYHSVTINNNFRYLRIDLFAQSSDKSPTAAKSYLLIDEIILTEFKNPFADKDK